MDVIDEDVIVRRVLYGGIARAAELFDTYVVDCAVNGVGRATRIAGDILRAVDSRAAAGLRLAAPRGRRGDGRRHLRAEWRGA